MCPEGSSGVFATTETSLGEPCGVPDGRLKLVSWPQWSLGACRPVLGGCLLVSGAGPESPVRKGAVRDRGVLAYVEAGGPKWGADSLPLFGCMLG
ncbi:hypothetical protein CRG98_046535 [Punica granatum]|uniref:Uncharacterized protein n=1 Tax=Punica granatum TaxID=22663 RepID=A0A2I0HMW8_PUNGR|nr:hypothetical protein CRG98_046535 [Punica granatum]